MEELLIENIRNSLDNLKGSSEEIQKFKISQILTTLYYFYRKNVKKESVVDHPVISYIKNF